MIMILVLSGVALLGCLALMRAAGGRKKTDVTTADLAVLLSAGEVAQLLYTLLKIDAALDLSSGSVAVIGVVCLVMVVGGVMFRWFAMVVTAAGLVAALLDAALNDGVELAGGLLMMIVTLWVFSRVIRLIVRR